MSYQNVRGKNLDYFTRTLEAFEDEHHAVAQSRVSHLKRFEIMLQLGDFNNKQLLDVGCGLGGFYEFLEKRNIHCHYTGIDINPKMIDAAKTKYPQISDRFFLFDILEKKMDRTFDYVVSVGPLNLKFEEGFNMSLTMQLIKEMYELSTVGSALSMTSSLTLKPHHETFYYDPSEILSKTAVFCRNVKIDHSYLPHDFTIFCYKRDLYS